MDPFQLRLECLQLTRRLTASQQSIGKVVEFLVKHAAVAADDMWDCVLGECEKTSLNAKLNILFLIDALILSIVDPSGVSSSSAVQKPTQTAGGSGASGSQDASGALSSYAQKAARDLDKIVDAVVPKNHWDAVRLNASSVQKVLASWTLLGIFPSARLATLDHQLQERKEQLSHLPSTSKTSFEPHEVLRRIEEDRERHKRLRERAWILPAKTFASCLQPRNVRSSLKPSPASPAQQDGADVRTQKSSNGSTTSASRTAGAALDALDVDFEQMWETTSDLNEDDYEQMREDDAAWWGGERYAQKQRARLEAVEAKAAGALPPGDAAELDRIDVEDDYEREAVRRSPVRKREASPARSISRRADDDDQERYARRRPSRDEDARAQLHDRWKPISDGQRGSGGFRPVQSSTGSYRHRDGGARHYDPSQARREHDRERDRDRDRDRERDRDRDRDRSGRRAWGPRAGYEGGRS